MNVVILTDSDTGFVRVPLKSIGAYKVASALRSSNIDTIVISHFLKLADFYPKELFTLLSKVVKNDTIFLGISATFLKIKPLSKEHKVIISIITFVKKLAPNIKIIVGGSLLENVSTIAQISKADHIIKGYADSTIVKLYHDILNKKSLSYIIDDDPLAKDYDFSNCAPSYSNIDGIQKEEALLLEISRGCRFKCKFCNFVLLGRNPKTDKYIRTRYSLAKELEHNYANFNTTDYLITCDTFNETTEKLETVYSAIKDVGIKINFSCYLRLELINVNREQISLLKEMGIKSATFGIESLNDRAAKTVGKGLGKDKLKSLLEDIYKTWGEDVRTQSNLIVGLPYDSVESINAWMSSIENNYLKIHNFTISPLGLFDGYDTEFNKHPEKYGYKLTETGWQNEYMDQQEAGRLAMYWAERLKKRNSYLGLEGVTGFRNYGWDYDKILSISMNDYENMSDIMKEQNKIFYKKYLNNMLFHNQGENK